MSSQGLTERKRKVLYVTQTTEGGSAFSLYYLAAGLDTRRYEPIVLFFVRQNLHVVEKLAERGIRTVFLGQSVASMDQSSWRPTLEDVGTARSACEASGLEAPPGAASYGGAPFGGELAALPADRPAGRRRSVGQWIEERLGRRAEEAYQSLKSRYEFLRRQKSRIRPIVRAIREHGVDIVHVNDGLPAGKAGILAARWTRRPCVCHVRMFPRLTGFDRLIGQHVGRFIYISRAIAESCTSQGIPADKGEVIHNAVSLEEYLAASAEASVRQEFGWTGGERLIGVAGRLDWWKGHEYFLEALALVARNFPGVRGLIIGQSETSSRSRAYGAQLISMTKSLGLEGKVVFTGFRPDVPRLLSALEVVVLSSSEPEPFGRVVIEGMAAGKPVVATAAGGVLDVVEDGVTGLLVPCKDSAAMARAVASLLADPDRARRMGEAGRRSVAERFTVQHHAARVMDVYDSLVGAE